MTEQVTNDPPFDRARFERAPCYLCGYNGPGYFQPGIHRCAARYHGYDLGVEQIPAKTLVERLRDVVPNEVTPVGEMWNLIDEAADEIERLTRERSVNSSR